MNNVELTQSAKIIYIDQPTAAAMTTYKELEKMYRRKDPVKYEEAIAKNKARYRNEMDQLVCKTDSMETKDAKH